MSLLPRTHPLAGCPVCGVLHPPGQPPCSPQPAPAQASSSTSPSAPPPQAESGSRSASPPNAPAPPRPSARPLSDEKIRSLVDQGIIVDEDAHGLRLTGTPVRGRGKGTGQLSPADIVRLAADLGGGVLPADQRRNCPHCDAVLPLQASRCEWCGKRLASPTT